MSDNCFYFGCWNKAGHFLFSPGGGYVSEERSIVYYNGDTHLDGTLAPQRRDQTGELVWAGMGTTRDERSRIGYRSSEYPQGQFLRHELDNGFTAIQWWDRNQGDKRGACNSTVLLRGKHTSAEMLAALAEHFPNVLARLTAAGVALVEVTVPETAT